MDERPNFIQFPLNNRCDRADASTGLGFLQSDKARLCVPLGKREICMVHGTPWIHEPVGR